jgi:transcriptional regulator with XRE-family HTH domain
MDVIIRIPVNGGYAPALEKRLDEYGISHAELARESGISPSHLSRMFNRPMEPSLETATKIELAVARIRARQKRERDADRRREQRKHEE